MINVGKGLIFGGVVALIIAGGIGIYTMTQNRAQQDKLQIEQTKARSVSEKLLSQKESSLKKNDSDEKTSTSEVSESRATSEGSKASSESSSASKKLPNDIFDDLPQKTQLALLVTTVWNDGNPYTDTNYGVYMGTANKIVIYDYGEGAGGWVDHVIRLTDNHDGSFRVSFPVTTGDVASANADNTTWEDGPLITKADMLSRFYATDHDKAQIAIVEDTLNLSTINQAFDILPA